MRSPSASAFDGGGRGGGGLDLPFLTADVSGIGGVIKAEDDDFVVEEVPLYVPCGEGSHVYFVIEKRGLTTYAAAAAVARALGRSPRDVGFAGLKDAHAVTRQTFSVEHVDPARIEALDLRRVRVLSVARHGNKLRTGHLKGNRFQIRIRQLAGEPAATLDRARAIMDVLLRRGVPNYFGPQRFGVRGDNWRVGRAVICGDLTEAVGVLLGRPGPGDDDNVVIARRLFDEGRLDQAAAVWPNQYNDQGRLCRIMVKTGGNVRKAWSAIHPSLRRLYTSAYQSYLFNRVVAARIENLGRVQTGDVAWKHVNGACFRVEDESREQPRCDAFEISPTGPLFGKRMTRPSGAPGELEAAVLADGGMTFEQFGGVPGGRRPLRVPIEDAEVTSGGDGRGGYVQLSFALPSGSYATCVTRELCKADVQVGDADD